MKIGNETWTILDQPQEGVIALPGLSTDARYAILRSAPDSPPYLLTHAATCIEVSDLSYNWPVRSSVELGGFGAQRGTAARSNAVSPSTR